MRSRFWLLLLALLPGCDAPPADSSQAQQGGGVATDMWGVHTKPGPPPRSEAQEKAYQEEKARMRELVRQKMLVPASALDGRAEYLVTDPSIVEPALDYGMEHYDSWLKVSEHTRLSTLTSSAAGEYWSLLKRPAGLKLQEQLIEKRFANPVVRIVKRNAPVPPEDRELAEKVRGVISKITGKPLPPRVSPPEGGVYSIEADYGWVPAPLYIHRNSPRQTPNSENLDGYEANSKLVARCFLEWLARYPELTEIALVMKTKNAGDGEMKRYSYFRSFVVTGIQGHVKVYSPGLPTTYPLGERQIQEDDFSRFLDGSDRFLGLPPGPVGTGPQQRKR